MIFVSCHVVAMDEGFSTNVARIISLSRVGLHVPVHRSFGVGAMATNLANFVLNVSVIFEMVNEDRLACISLAAGMIKMSDF